MRSLRQFGKWLRELARTWGTTVTITFLVGSTCGGLVTQYVAPVAWFLVAGNGKLSRIETEVAAMKRRQAEQCHVNYSALWWMVAVSDSLKVPEPPGARTFVAAWPAVCEDNAMAPLARGTPSWLGTAYAEDLPNP